MVAKADAVSKRTRVLSAATLMIACVASLAIAELALRLLGLVGYTTFVFRQYDPTLGTALIPGSRGVHRWCWDGFVSINAFGMRDEERSLRKPAGTTRIGLFGDSVVEAVHVRPEQTAAYLLQQELAAVAEGEAVEVLNFSVASYSTVQEYLRYKTLGRCFDLDLVIVVTIPNDLVANVDPGNPIAGSLYNAPYLRRVGSSFEIVPPQPPSSWLRLVAKAATHSKVVLFSAKAYYKMLQPRPKSEPRWASSPEYAYYDLQDTNAQMAWDALDFMLGRFRRVVEDDGGRFALGFIASEDLAYLTPPPTAEAPPSVVPDRMRREMAAIGTRYAFPVHSIGLDLARYVREERLGPPYLAYKCDPHLNVEGQRVLANSLFRFIVERHLLDLGDRGRSAVDASSTGVKMQRTRSEPLVAGRTGCDCCP